MRQILSDSQSDPRALMDHMKNPMVRLSSGPRYLANPSMKDRGEDPKAD